jgi:hypothetical protein
VTVTETSHVGVVWSDAVAALLARFTTDPQQQLPTSIAGN